MVTTIKKFKLSSTPSTSRFDIGEARHELRTRLRFQSKKPLCLQYNLSATQKTKKVLQRMKRRNCGLKLVDVLENNLNFSDSFTKVFIPYLISLIYALIGSTGKLIEFLFKPVEELNLNPVNPSFYRREFFIPDSCLQTTLSRSPSTLSRRSSSRSKKSRKRDFGRNARLRAQQNRFAEFCVFP